MLTVDDRGGAHEEVLNERNRLKIENEDFQEEIEELQEEIEKLKNRKPETIEKVVTNTVTVKGTLHLACDVY